MTALLYGTVWIALGLFVLGQDRRRPLLWLAGAAVCALHMAVAMGWRYGWNLEAAGVATARQTEAVVGVGWTGGVYVNVVFVALWLADAIWWWRCPLDYATRPRLIEVVSRVFYFVVIASAAVVFASWPGRIVGVPLVAWLLIVWRRQAAPVAAVVK